jgi:CheY-like chemotaxis protein
MSEPYPRTELNILIIDDDVDVGKALGRLLGACGHIVQVSNNPHEGIELASRIGPDLILLDIAMQRLDGYEAARGLRELPSLSGTILIACSALVDENMARAAGFDGWLVKPISGSDLDVVLAIVLKRVNQSTANSASSSG